MGSQALPHPTAKAPAGYIFNGSGLPVDLMYLADISVTAAADMPYVEGVDVGRNQYGRIALSSVGTSYQFTLACPLSSAANTANIGNNQVRIAMKQAGASALIFFVRDAAGNSLSASLALGPVI